MTATFVNFAYGSNMFGPRLRQRAPSARAVGIGRLERHRLRWHKRARDGSAKCDVVETGRDGDAVWGVLFEIARADKPQLDRAEGLGHGYDEKPVTIVTAAGPVAALTYFATAVDASLPVHDWYRDLVVAGAREHGLPPEYVDELLAQPVAVDPDAMRRAANLQLLKSAPATRGYSPCGQPPA